MKFNLNLDLDIVIKTLFTLKLIILFINDYNDIHNLHKIPIRTDNLSKNKKMCF